ncbi:MAG: DUF4157 domain-containing protein [Xanthobacteraceae bacterium]
MTMRALAPAKADATPSRARPSAAAIQTKARVGPVDDPLEHEADRVADAVLRDAPSGPIATAANGIAQRKCAACEEEEKSIQRKCAHCEAEEQIQRQAADQAVSAVQSGGAPLSAAQRAYFEPRLSHDMSAVRLHTDAGAASAASGINARAYTLGSDIAFAPREYSPGTTHGDHLLAHELAHVVQQTGGGGSSPVQRAPQEPVIRRDAATPDADAAPQADPAPTTAEPQASDESDDSTDVTLVNDRVQKILVSCADNRMAIQTRRATYMYRLYQCDKTFPPGEYTAGVEPIEKEDLKKSGEKTRIQEGVQFIFNTGGRRRVFRGGYSRKKGQPSPKDLLKDQDNVTFVFGASPKQLENFRPECLVTVPRQTLFSDGGSEKDLTEYLPKVPQFEWKLAEFGLGDVTMRVGVQATAKAAFSYDEGVLDDICLSGYAKRTPRGENRLADAVNDAAGAIDKFLPGASDAAETLSLVGALDPTMPLTGRAQFTTGGEADLHMDIAVGLEVAAEALGLVDILTAHGELKLDLDASVAGDVKALAEIEFDPKQRQPFGLKTDLELAAMAAIGAKLSGSAGLDFLGFSLWEGHTTFAEGNLDYGWTGGLVFDNSFIPQPSLGAFAKGSGKQLRAGALRTAGPSRPAARKKAQEKRDGIPIRELVESKIKDSNGELKLDGLSCDKALPLHWFKIRSLYPGTLSFHAPGVHPESVSQEDEPVDVSHPDIPTTKWRRGGPIPGETLTNFSPIGVDQENWPETGRWAKCFTFIPPEKDPDPSKTARDESNLFRQLLKGLDTYYDGKPPNEGTVQMDHVRELQFGGKDQFNNIWPYDNRANQSAGRLHQAQIDAYRKLFSHLSPPAKIEGRRFRISSFGPDPDLAAKLDKQ